MTERKINGAAVRAIRCALGITQADLAARIKKDKGYLCRIENGSQFVGAVSTQRAIADALGVSIEAVTYPVAGTAA